MNNSNIKKNPKIFCVVSTSNRDPFKRILQEGTFPAWMQSTSQLQVCTMEAGFDNRIIRFWDRTRERMRYSSRLAAAIGQISDLFYLPLIFWVPKFRILHSKPYLRFVLPMPEVLTLYRWRYLAALQYFVKNTDCEYIYNVNTSCFINEHALISTIQSLGAFEYAGTAVPDTKCGIFFASGANRLISRATANEILRKRHYWSLTCLEDLALGRMMSRLKIPLVEIFSINLSDESQVEEIPAEIFSSTHHFRLKSFRTDPEGGQGTRNDVALFQKVVERFKHIEKN